MARRRRIPRRLPRTAPPGRTVGPKELIASLRVLEQTARAAAQGELPGTPPAGWPGTYPEWLVARYLTELGLNFVYIPRLAGEAYPGGIEADFVVDLGPEKLAIMVNGDYWHGPRQGPEKGVRDMLKVLTLSQAGFKVVTVWESAIYRYGRAVVEAAVAGIELGPA